jgi:hypothetical protein
MNIVIAAEKNSIASLLSDFIDAPVTEDDIAVVDNPDETGSFYIGHRFGNYRLTPTGEILRSSGFSARTPAVEPSPATSSTPR